MWYITLLSCFWIYDFCAWGGMDGTLQLPLKSRKPGFSSLGVFVYETLPVYAKSFIVYDFTISSFV